MSESARLEQQLLVSISLEGIGLLFSAFHSNDLLNVTIDSRSQSTPTSSFVGPPAHTSER